MIHPPSRLHPCLKSAVALLAALFAAGCTTYVRDTAWEPAVYSFGPANRFVLTELSGRAVHRAPFLDALRRQVRETDWWQFEDRRGTASSPTHPEIGEVRVQMQIYEMDLDKRYDPNVDSGKEGKPASIDLNASWEGLVSFAVTAQSPEGQVVMRTREYTASGESEDIEGAEGRLREKLLREAIAGFLDDITPREATRLLRVDVEREDMKPIAELVRERRYHSAFETLQQMGRTQPQRPDLLYNIGVVLQGMGQYAEALDHYNRAIQNGPKDYYRNARKRCIDRIEAMQEFDQ